MPPESQKRLAQTQLLLYYITSYRCQYRHRGGSLPTSVLCCHPAPASQYLLPPPLKGQGRFHNLRNNNFGNPIGGDTQIGKCLDRFLIDFSSGRGKKSPTPYLQVRAWPLHLQIFQLLEGEGTRTATLVTVLSLPCLLAAWLQCSSFTRLLKPAVLQDFRSQRFFLKGIPIPQIVYEYT